MRILVPIVMVSSCIKLFLLVQSVNAICKGKTKSCMLPSQDSELALFQKKGFRLRRTCDVDLPARENMYWMHVPKTGTSFKFTMLNVNSNYALGRFPGRPGRFHEPLPKDASNELLSNFTTMLRDPAQRLASALSYIQEMRLPQFGWMFTEHHGCGAADVSELVKKGNTPLNDDCLASLTGCQTNMLVGHGCMSAASHNMSDVDLAKSRLDKFFFVGVVEEWELSMCLFNFKLTGKRFVEPCQKMDSRPTDKSVPRTEAKSHVYDVTGYPHDEADEAIYQHGKERFLREIAEHGISKESCASTPTLEDTL